MRTCVLLILSFLGVTLAHAKAASHIEDYRILPADASHLPAPFKDSVIFPGTTSPNGKYAFIYPNRQAAMQFPKVEMSLVTLTPFRVVQEMPEFFEFFASNSTRGDFEANWPGIARP